MKGKIHSIESFGTVDGPGVRLVVFLQGCPLRCRYCHNPDTWNTAGGQEMQVEQIMELYRKNRPFYQKGGITLTGGEPLLQAAFAEQLFRCCKEEGIHTALDTSGITFDGSDKYEGLLQWTDLVMLDIKHIRSDAHKELTGADNKNVLAFAKYLQQKGIALWARHVVVPGITDQKEDLMALGRFLGQLTNLKALDVLPYHTLGVHKYKEMGLDYTLQGVMPPDQKEIQLAKGYILSGISQARQGI